MVRHGERADKAEGGKIKVDLAFDPHLTKTGIQQAYATGAFIESATKEAIKMQLVPPAPKYLILSSPFLRCVQTAFQIVKALGDDKILNNSIFIDDGLGEILKAKYFDKNPLPLLTVRSKNEGKQAKYYAYPVKEDFIKGSIIPKHPETVPDCNKRTELAYKTIMEYIWKEIGYKDLVVVIVTHGITCEIILKSLGEWDPKRKVDLCSIQQIYYPIPDKATKGYKVLMKQTTKHGFKGEDEEMIMV
jgi:broad specificity phosphatase PhoE